MNGWLSLPLLLAALAAPCDPPVATFSIAARDPANGDLGVAVASRFLAVGSVVPWAEPGIGAVATQAWANTTFGPKGLALLRTGLPAEEVVSALVRTDEAKERRQLGIVDATGRASAWTGSDCLEWAGHRTGRNWTAQGNILAGPEVVEAMGHAFEETEGELAERLLAALAAGEAAGGDRRGRQSAALLVVRDGAGFGGSDRYVDLRVDDHAEPVAELRRLLGLQLSMARAVRAYRLHEEGRTAEGARLLEEALRFAPDSAETRYNAACLHALAGNRERAYALLEQALEGEPGLRELARGDPDFETMRGEERFRALVGGEE
jgi:uncharacterized Ntn-hydrolase superfamily protein